MDWSIQLSLRPDAGPSAQLEAMLRDLVRGLARRYDEVRSAESDPPFFGEWEIARTSDELVLTVRESELFEPALNELASALHERGVQGTIALYEGAPAVTPPGRAPMLACRMYVRGSREEKPDRWYRWVPDPTAHAAIVSLATSWSRWDGQADACSLHVGTSGYFAVGSTEPIDDRVLADLGDGGMPLVTGVRGDAFRAVAARPFSGLITFVTSIGRGGWREPVADFVDLLAGNAGRLAYGHVWRGCEPGQAMVDEAISARDWPRRELKPDRGRGFSDWAFRDILAPDVFGVQLLGPGFGGRVSPGDVWSVRPVADDALLVSHLDAQAWFDAPFETQWRHWMPGQPEPPVPPLPPVLADGRVELAAILEAPDAFARLGFPELEHSPIDVQDEC